MGQVYAESILSGSSGGCGGGGGGAGAGVAVGEGALEENTGEEGGLRAGSVIVKLESAAKEA